MDADETGHWISAIGKHVIKFQQDGYSAAVFATPRTSQEVDLLIRMRQQGRMTAKRCMRWLAIADCRETPASARSRDVVA